MKKIGLIALAVVVISLIAIQPTLAVVGDENQTVAPSSIRIYGECGVNAPDSWRFWWEPYDPNAIPKDSWTTNPAYIPIDVGVQVDNENAREKVYLRGWYEPCSVFGGPRKINTYQAIVLEYTYLLMTTTYTPTEGHAYYNTNGQQTTKIYIPVAEKDGQFGLGKVESGNAHWRNILLAQINGNSRDSDNANDHVNANKTMWGEIWLEKWYSPASMENDYVQFFDHKVKVVGYYAEWDPNANQWRNYPIVEVCYAGNVEDDECVVNIILRPDTVYWFDRHNQIVRDDPIAPGGPRPYPPQDASWYIVYETDQWVIKVGKFLSADPNSNVIGAKVFYVNGVRYEVAAIELVDTDGDGTYDEFKSITIRSKLPKGDGVYPDESWVSSQWVVGIPRGKILPVLPPFNEEHDMVDDINVPCNHNTEEQLRTDPTAPCNVHGAVCDVDTDGDGVCICYDVDERIINNVDPFKALYVDENIEMRYSTNLLEKLEEEQEEPYATTDTVGSQYLREFWGKFDIQSLPDLYTEFVLPPLPDVQVAADMGMYGDYFIETSFIGDEVTKNVVLNGTQIQTHRMAFVYDPVYTTDDLYVNYNEDNDVNTVRIYGNDSETIRGFTWYYSEAMRDTGPWGAPTVYNDEDWQAPFNPTYVIKDSITFDPTIIEYSRDYPMSADGVNAEEKQYVRIMYAPAYDFFGEHYSRWYTDEEGNRVRATEPAVVIDYIYMLIDRQDKKPMHGSPGSTWIAIPFVSKEPFNGLDAFENDGVETSKPNVMLISHVWATGDCDELGKTTNGTIVLEKQYVVEPGDVVWIFDHAFRYDGVQTTYGGVYSFANFTVWYTGNAVPHEPDNWGAEGTKTTIDVASQLGTEFYFDRHNNRDTTAHHPDRTTFLRVDAVMSGGRLLITVGKEISKGDIFYVDGVRYEVPAVAVVYDPTNKGCDWDNCTYCGGDVQNCTDCYDFKYLVLRTPIPKWEDAEEGVCPNADYYSEKADWGPITSQWILKWPPCCPLPILPPASWDDRKIVDDTDVPLWKPLKHLDKWPYGDPNGVPGVEYFPEGERYITMQYPPVTWLIFFHAVPIDMDNDMSPEMPTDYQRWEGPYYPDTIDDDIDFPIKWIVKLPESRISGGFYYDDVYVEYDGHDWTVRTIASNKEIASGFDQYTPFDSQAWIANDVDERIIDAPALDVCWKSNGKELRFSTNLLEVLDEYWDTEDMKAKEYWTVIWTDNRADRYVELKVPNIPSVDHIVYVGQKEFVQDFRKHPGSFIITTAWTAPNGLGDLNENQKYAYLTNGGNEIVKTGPDPRFAFTWNVNDGLGIYVNENVTIPRFEGNLSFEIRLDQGHNYVSIPVTLSVTDPDAIFGVDTEVWTFENGTWKRVTSLEPGKGYYVYSVRPKTVVVKGYAVEITADDILNSLQDGWNLVGVGSKPIKAEDLQGVLVMKWDSYLKMFVPVPPGEDLKPTKAYWIYK